MEGYLLSVKQAWLWNTEKEPESATTACERAASLAPPKFLSMA
jgi:hypothetical protein